MNEEQLVIDINEWQHAKSNLDEAKELEMKLRVSLVDQLVEDDVGKIKLELPFEAFTVKAEKKVSTKFDFTKFQELVEGKVLSETEFSVVEYKPKIVNKNLKALEGINPESIIFELITLEPAAPTLSISTS